MTIRQWGALALAATALSACDGCGKMDYAPFREVPFCANDKLRTAPRLAKSYVLVTKHGNGYGVQGMRDMGRERVIGHNDRLFFALLECAGPTIPAPALEKELSKMTKTHMPSICPGMSVVHQDELTAQEDSRSKGLGHSGYFVFPKIALPCKDGTLVRREPYTLSEHIRAFQDSVNAYVSKHENKLPTNMTTLVADTAAKPLPKDPWGSDLVVTFSASEVVVTSNGPDKAPGTADDQEVTKIEPSSARSITVFKGTNYTMYGDYDAFLKAPSFTADEPAEEATPKKGEGGATGEGGAKGQGGAKAEPSP